jgi:hypothetical protein
VPASAADAVKAAAAAAAALEAEGLQDPLNTTQGLASEAHLNPSDPCGAQQAGQVASVFPYDASDPAAAAAAAAAAALPADAAFAAAAGPNCNSNSSSSFKSPRLQQLLQLRELFSSRGITLSAMGLAIRDTGPEEGGCKAAA